MSKAKVTLIYSRHVQAGNEAAGPFYLNETCESKLQITQDAEGTLHYQHEAHGILPEFPLIYQNNDIYILDTLPMPDEIIEEKETDPGKAGEPMSAESIRAVLSMLDEPGQREQWLTPDKQWTGTRFTFKALMLEDTVDLPAIVIALKADLMMLGLENNG